MTRTIARFGAIALIIAGNAAFAQEKPVASNMRLVGYSDLQARSAYQPWVHHQGDRWIAYIGHHGGIPGNEKPLNALTGQAGDPHRRGKNFCEAVARTRVEMGAKRGRENEASVAQKLPFHMGGRAASHRSSVPFEAETQGMVRD